MPGTTLAERIFESGALSAPVPPLRMVLDSSEADKPSKHSAGRKGRCSSWIDAGCSTVAILVLVLFCLTSCYSEQ